MVFTTSLWNIILGIVAVFFLFRFLEVPDQARSGGDAHQEHDGSGGEQKSEKPHEQTHVETIRFSRCAAI